MTPTRLYRHRSLTLRVVDGVILDPHQRRRTLRGNGRVNNRFNLGTGYHSVIGHTYHLQDGTRTSRPRAHHAIWWTSIFSTRKPV